VLQLQGVWPCKHTAVQLVRVEEDVKHSDCCRMCLLPTCSTVRVGSARCCSSSTCCCWCTQAPCGHQEQQATAKCYQHHDNTQYSMLAAEMWTARLSTLLRKVLHSLLVLSPCVQLDSCQGVLCVIAYALRTTHVCMPHMPSADAIAPAPWHQRVTCGQVTSVHVPADTVTLMTASDAFGNASSALVHGPVSRPGGLWPGGNKPVT
jgi:hypothetical protein